MTPKESWASSPRSRRVMLGNRSRDTKPEMAVRRACHARGLRYRVDVRPLPELRRRADLVFPTERIAVFVDGCYWHGCPEHYVASKSNADYWRVKIARNRERDADTDATLLAAGWRVVRAWQHEDPGTVADAVAAVVRARRAG
ncbi:very short patch repair endonuclease [Microbacterium sp. NPDC091676]|uniref:very short patch repair endonuclease n=1 Tax=Microbacterium sp. NPDC091676 TaxID=3364212 RepID=UPI0038152F98